MNTRLALKALAFGITATASLEVFAADAHGSSSTESQLRGDNRNGRSDDDNFSLLSERLELRAVEGSLIANARFDGDLFIAAPDERYRSVLVAERLSVGYRVADFHAVVGDFAAQLGHGTALSVRQVPGVGVDRAVRGARLHYAGDLVEILALAGVANAAGKDELTLRAVDDPGDVIAGGEATWFVRPGLRCGALTSLVVPSERILANTIDMTATTGMVIAADFLGTHGSVEVDVQERRLATTANHGAAATGALTVPIGDWATMLVEALWLSSMEVKGSRNSATGVRFEYNEAPTLERPDQEVQNTRDVLGGRARVDAPTPVGTAFVSAMVKLNDPLTPAETAQGHIFGGIDSELGPHRALITVGAREEQQRLKSIDPLRIMMHADVDALISLGRGFALHPASNVQIWQKADRHSFIRGTAVLSFERTGHGSVGAEVGVDTEDLSPGARQLFLASVVTWHVVDGVELFAMAGAQRGGVRCAGGVCREVPSFAGAKSALRFSF